ncbi:MAG: response regulator [Planctomycetaceae bacterium]
MLVLSRRRDESIVFPNVGITIKILRVDRNKAKVGITAPAGIRILRSEVQTGFEDPVFEESSSETLHAIRNRLNTVNLSIHLYHQQMANGQVDAANVTFLRLVDDLESIDREVERQQMALDASDEAEIRCLLVEDDPRQRELLASYLENRGVNVHTASGADEAINQLVHGDLPDFVLLDLRLPGTDGAETVKRIRQRTAQSSVQILAVSGTSPKELGISTGAQGVDHWFPKPTNPEKLIERMSVVPERTR